MSVAEGMRGRVGRSILLSVSQLWNVYAVRLLVALCVEELSCAEVVVVPGVVDLWVADALVLESDGLLDGAGEEVGVVESEAVEEVELLLVEEQRRGDGVDWCVAPALVEEAAALVEEVEVGAVCV